MPTTTTTDFTEIARCALENVCSGEDIDGISRVYHPDFVDHVNQLTYRGHEGARRSIAKYVTLFPELEVTVVDQVTEGEKVASRWTMNGTHRGRAVTLWGIVISRFEDGRIVEDWATNDTIDLARQLGLWRTLRLLAVHRKLVFASDEPSETHQSLVCQMEDWVTGKLRPNRSCAIPPSDADA